MLLDCIREREQMAWKLMDDGDRCLVGAWDRTDMDMDVLTGWIDMIVFALVNQRIHVSALIATSFVMFDEDADRL